MSDFARLRARALRHLKQADPVMKRLIERVGPCRFLPDPSGSHFDHVVRAIIYQQLSGKAAGTIHSRVKALFGGRNPSPQEILNADEAALRGAGLSRPKLSYLKDFASRIVSDELKIDDLHQFDNAEIIRQLVQVKGIGTWTAEMFLMFRLGRPDVLPTLDLGIKKAIQREYQLRKLPEPKKTLAVGACWQPYASFACWYLWRSLDPQ
jgi:DNA-3-methyladenine glycosylase II